MLLSTHTENPTDKFTEFETVKIISYAGFDAYDISLFKVGKSADYMFNQDDYLTHAKKLREFADGLGLVCNQAHAPFPSSVGDNKIDSDIFNSIVRSMEIASVLGAKIIVVHPKQHLCYAENIEKLFEINVEFYNSLIPYCEKFGIKVATENMWQYNANTKSPIDSTCSRAWEFNKYIDAINNEWIVGCLDIGHVSLMNTDIPTFIREMGNKRLQALHVHDTNFVNDCHTVPFMEKIDFKSIAKALAEIDYKGDFTFEANNFFANKPFELYPATAKYMCEIGRYLISEIEKYK